MTPLANRRGARSGELREVEARLMVGAIGLERVCSGGSAVGVSSPGFRAGRRRRSGAWSGGTGKSAKGKGGGPPGFDARERRGVGALRRASHGGIAVAAGGGLTGRVARDGGSSARQRRAVKVQRDA